MAFEAVETSPLLSAVEPTREEKLKQQIVNKRESIALNIADRCINSETAESFTTQEIIRAIIDNNITIDINKPVYDAAGEIISILASSGSIPIVHKEDPDLLHAILIDHDHDHDQESKKSANNNNDKDENKDEFEQSSTKSEKRHSQPELMKEVKIKIVKYITVHSINQDTN